MSPIIRKSKSRFALVTLYGDYNFGNRLQNYALTKAIELCTGYVPTTLRIVNDPLRTRYGDARGAIGAVKRHRYKRLRLFRDFTKNHIPTQTVKPVDISSMADVFILGSDQIWNPEWGLGARDDGVQCLSQVDGARKIAYAASFGIDLKAFPSKWLKLYADWLVDFPFLSVRENEGADIVRAMTGRTVPVVLDPTMLLDSPSWSSLEKQPSICLLKEGTPYCLKYVLGSDDAKESIEDIANHLELTVIDLSDRSLRVGPAEFVWLIHNASLVCTDSYHGSVFSLLFKTPFLIFKRTGNLGSMHSRLITLVDTFGVRDAFFDGHGFLPDSILQRDWSSIDEVLAARRSQSWDFLKCSLNGMKYGANK